MPELPEVETMCRGIAPIVGRTIAAVTKPPCRYRPIVIHPATEEMDVLLSGAKVARISRLGKRVLVHAAGHALVLQPKMSGLVSIDEVPDAEHVRLCLQFKGRPPLRLQFWDRRGLGTVELLAEDEIERRIVQGRLGPDALAIELSEFEQRLAGTRRAIKVALLDQKLLAGVGNLYASEMLHVAKIHPATPSAALSRRRVAELYACMQAILRTAVELEGSTLADGTYRNALNNPGSYQNHHRVYGRAEQACPSCHRGKILRIVQAQRSTFFCPRCQKEPRGNA